MSTEVKPSKPLSPREAEILTFYMQGRGPMDIAREMGLSVKTISTYLVRCQKKYGVDNNRQLLVLLAPPREVANG